MEVNMPRNQPVNTYQALSRRDRGAVTIFHVTAQ